MKIAALVANGSEDIEVITPIDLWRRAGIRVDLISTEKKKICILSRGNKISCDMTLDKVNLSQYDGIYLPGGEGALKFKDDKKLIINIPKFASSGKWILALCGAPEIFADMGVLNGITFAAQSGNERKSSGNYSKNRVHADKNFITGSGAGSAFEFGLLAIEKLINKEKANEVAKKTQFVQ